MHSYADGQRALFDRTRARAWYVEVADTRHADFTDAPFGSPLLALTGMTSTGDGSHTHEVMRRTTAALFDRALRADLTPSVLDADAPWPGVTVARR